MDAIIFCDGDCAFCKGKECCPYKNDEKFHLDLLLNKLTEEVLTVDNIFSIITENISIYNQIQVWKILLDSDPKYEVFPEIKRFIYSQMNDNISELSGDMRERLNHVLTEIVNKLEQTVRNECEKEGCHSCFLKNCCS